jgi:4-amino-4-deoxy-L-arabinose transferase-like glycosyltransferase
VSKWNRKGGWAIGGLLVTSGLILFFNLWARSLENHDYLRYAEVAREMIRSGDWIIPRYNGKIFLDKPPLLFWFIAIPSYIYGSVTPLLARLPSALSAWIGTLLLFLWGRKIYGTTQSGLIAGGIALSSYQYFFQARLAKTDMLLCFFILLSLYFFYLGYGASGKRRYLFHVLSFFAMGLGTLTKGPFGLFIPLFVISLFLIKERRWSLLISREFILGYVIIALALLPWVFLFIHRIGFEQTVTLVKDTRILTRRAPIYFYFIRIWGEFFPWSLLLPFLFVHLWHRKGRTLCSGEWFFLIWFIALFLLLTLFQYRASRYLLPALPPLALMMGGMWKKRILFFLMPFIVFIFLWHGVEINWVAKDPFHSPGMVLARELRPFLKGSTLFGYQLDVSTVEEINFYLDPVVPMPLSKKGEDLSEPLRRIEKGLVLMPKEVYEKVRSQREDTVFFIQEFSYKKGELVLVSKRVEDHL